MYELQLELEEFRAAKCAYNAWGAVTLNCEDIWMYEWIELNLLKLEWQFTKKKLKNSSNK